MPTTRDIQRAITLQRDSAYAHQQSEISRDAGRPASALLWQLYSMMDHGRMRHRLDFPPRGTD